MRAERSISRDSSLAIFDDALAAYSAPDHPCHVFRSLQTGVTDSEWQLPEPFNGRSARAGLVFLGLNPSYDPSEPVPRVNATFDEWDAFYRRRFDGPKSIWHKKSGWGRSVAVPAASKAPSGRTTGSPQY